MCIDKFEEMYHERQCFQLNNNEARWRCPHIEDDICVISKEYIMNIRVSN